MSQPPVGILQGRLTPPRNGRIQFFPVDSWEGEFPQAAQIGFGHMEVLLMFEDEYRKHPLWSEEGVSRLMTLGESHGILFPSAHVFFRWRNHPRESVEALFRIMPAVSKIGGRVMLIPFFDEDVIRNGEDKKEVVRLLRPVADKAAEYGIRLGLEAEIKAGEFGEFIVEFNHPAVGIYYDVGNMAGLGVDVPAEIRLLGKLIVGVHLKDKLIGGKSVPLGAGSVDFPGVFRALAEAGYWRPFILEGAKAGGGDMISLNQWYYSYVDPLVVGAYHG